MGCLFAVCNWCRISYTLAVSSFVLQFFGRPGDAFGHSTGVEGLIRLGSDAQREAWLAGKSPLNGGLTWFNCIWNVYKWAIFHSNVEIPEGSSHCLRYPLIYSIPTWFSLSKLSCMIFPKKSQCQDPRCFLGHPIAVGEAITAL